MTDSSPVRDFRAHLAKEKKPIRIEELELREEPPLVVASTRKAVRLVESQEHRTELGQAIRFVTAFEKRVHEGGKPFRSTSLLVRDVLEEDEPLHARTRMFVRSILIGRGLHITFRLEGSEGDVAVLSLAGEEGDSC